MDPKQPKKSTSGLTLGQLLSRIGLFSTMVLAMAACGLVVLLLNLAGVVPAGSHRVPDIGDPRPLLISVLGLIIIGLTPLMIRLVYDDLKK